MAGLAFFLLWIETCVVEFTAVKFYISVFNILFYGTAEIFR